MRGKILAAVAAALISLGSANASHLVGGFVTYDCIGTDSFVVHLTVYRDCDGIALGPTANIEVYDSLNNLSVVAIPLIWEKPLWPQYPDPCLIPFNFPCISEGYYSDTIVLGSSAGGYTLAFQQCCRPAIASNLVNPGSQQSTYSASIPDPGAVVCNSGPEFSNAPPMIMCVNELFKWDHGATDPDGDSLVYSLCATNGSTGGPPPFPPATYAVPFSPGFPMPGNPPLSIESTGMLCIQPTALGRYAVAICVEEYRNGVKIGEYKRDYEIAVVNCEPTNLDSLPTTANICLGDTLPTINHDLGAYTFFWDFGTGDPGDTSNLAFPTFMYDSAGQYTVTAIVNPGLSCSDTAYITVTVSDPPTVVATGLDSFYLIGSPPDTLSGSPPGGVFTGQGMVGNVFDPNLAGIGTHAIIYFYADSTGCNASDTLTTVVDSVTGVAPRQDLALVIAPNPSTGVLRIRLSKPSSTLLQVFDATGRLRQSDRIVGAETTFSIHHLPSGSYLVRVVGDDVSAQQVVIKQ